MFLACGSTDLRKSIGGLAAIVQESFGLNPFYLRLEHGRFHNGRFACEAVPRWRNLYFGEVYRRALQLTVADNGIGMSAEQLERVRRKLENTDDAADDSESERQESRTGVGLKRVYLRFYHSNQKMSVKRFGTTMKY